MQKAQKTMNGEEELLGKCIERFTRYQRQTHTHTHTLRDFYVFFYLHYYQNQNDNGEKRSTGILRIY